MDFGSWLYIASIFIGIFFGFCIRNTISKQKGAKKKIYKKFELFAIKILLPIHIFLTIIRSQEYLNFQNFISLALAGIGYSLCALVLAHFITMSGTLKVKCFPHMKYAVSTFGGGGRAVVFIAALQPLLLDNSALNTSSPSGLSFDALAVFDLGYWLFFCLVIYRYIMPSSYEKSTSKSDSKDKEDLLNIGHKLVVVAAFLGFMIILLGKELFIDSVGGIEKIVFTRDLITGAIVMLSAAALVLRFESVRIGSSWLYICLIVSIRVGAFILPTLYIYSQYPEFFKLLFIPLVVMVVSPPSSYVHFMLSEVGAKTKAVDQIININASWNILYFVVVLILLLIGLMKQMV